MVLLFLHGFPGVGKLTIGRELEALTGYPLFHNHLTVDLATAVFDFGSPEFVSLREHIWLEAFGRAAEAALPGLIFTFAAEQTVEDGFADRAVSTVAAAGGDTVFVELTCDREELRRRIKSPDRRQYGKLSSADLFDRLIAAGVLYRLVAPVSARQIAVDTTDRTPEDAASAIMRQIHHG